MYLDDNLILALSNIAVLPAVISAEAQMKHGEFILLLLIAIFSGLQHASDTKHSRQPQSEDLRKLSVVFLNLDRIFAVLGSIYVGKCFWYEFERMCPWLFIGAVGLSFMFMSEAKNKKTTRTMRTLLHLGWHLSAYAILYVCVSGHVAKYR